MGVRFVVGSVHGMHGSGDAGAPQAENVHPVHVGDARPRRSGRYVHPMHAGVGIVQGMQHSDERGQGVDQ